MCNRKNFSVAHGAPRGSTLHHVVHHVTMNNQHVAYAQSIYLNILGSILQCRFPWFYGRLNKFRFAPLSLTLQVPFFNYILCCYFGVVCMWYWHLSSYSFRCCVRLLQLLLLIMKKEQAFFSNTNFFENSV